MQLATVSSQMQGRPLAKDGKAKPTHRTVPLPPGKARDEKMVSIMQRHSRMPSNRFFVRFLHFLPVVPHGA